MFIKEFTSNSFYSFTAFIYFFTFLTKSYGTTGVDHITELTTSPFLYVLVVWEKGFNVIKFTAIIKTNFFMFIKLNHWIIIIV
jgi:hypothetical protein